VKTTIKQKIVEATIAMMREEENISKITIRKIARSANIGVGLINYHFQTKQNLINQCVRIFMGKIISTWDKIIPRQKSIAPNDHLKKMLMATLQFMTEYPRISRISILNDINNPSSKDNTSQTLKGILPLLAEINNNNKPEATLLRLGYKLLFTLQMVFLKAHLLKEETGFDFYNPTQRENYLKSEIDKLIENISKEN
jgi:AcrR family transcriptional regulator